MSDVRSPSLYVEVSPLSSLGPPGPAGPAGPPGPAGKDGQVPEAPTDSKHYGRVNAAWAPVLPIQGGTLTGALLLANDPAIFNEAATKSYVDNKVASEGVSSFNTRQGAVTLSSADLTLAGGLLRAGGTMTGLLTLSGLPTANGHAANKQYVDTKVGTPVTSWNTRTGAVTLALADVTGVGGAPLASPTFTGVPAAPTAATGTKTTQLATTAFVDASIRSVTPPVRVDSFNTRTGAVTLNLADVTSVGGAPVASPTFTGVPAAPTAAFGTKTTQIATTAFVDTAMRTVGPAFLPLTAGPTRVLTDELHLDIAPPSAPNVATTRQYVNDEDAKLQAQITLLASNLLWVGSINVVADACDFTPASGQADGPLPLPAAALANMYLIVIAAGAPPAGNIPGGTYGAGDWLVCDGIQWIQLPVGQTTALASSIPISPAIGSLGPNVQTGLQWLDDNKLDLTGDTMAGPIVFAPAQVVDGGIW